MPYLAQSREFILRRINLQQGIVVALCLLCLTTVAIAQQSIFGTNNYVEYQVGTLPFVISVPHGGSLEPFSIPTRTCNNAVNVNDALTIETALEIRNRFFAITGCYPHIIISHLRRTKLDPNRNLADAACGNSQAIVAWNEFHNFIATARNIANQQYNNQTLFVDLHGHGNPIQRIELGYLLRDDELELSDSILNTAKYLGYSSIRNLALSNASNSTHAQLLRGSKAFGTLLTNNNFPAVPSQNIPFPGITSNYFSGGYITANHTCYAPGVQINGFQMELNFTNLRDTPARRTAFAVAFTQAMIEYMNTHFTMNWNACRPLSTGNNSRNSSPEFYPNPAKKGDFVTLDVPQGNRYHYTIFDLTGHTLATGQLGTGTTTISTENLPSGVYLLQVSTMQHTIVMIRKLIVQ